MDNQLYIFLYINLTIILTSTNSNTIQLTSVPLAISKLSRELCEVCVKQTNGSQASSSKVEGELNTLDFPCQICALVETL